VITAQVCRGCRQLAVTGAHVAIGHCRQCLAWHCPCLECLCTCDGIGLEEEAAELQRAADSEPDPDRASVLRRAAADVSVIAERVR
jgi:hypothetical protein